MASAALEPCRVKLAVTSCEADQTSWPPAPRACCRFGSDLALVAADSIERGSRKPGPRRNTLGNAGSVLRRFPRSFRRFGTWHVVVALQTRGARRQLQHLLQLFGRLRRREAFFPKRCWLLGALRDVRLLQAKLEKRRLHADNCALNKSNEIQIGLALDARKTHVGLTRLAHGIVERDNSAVLLRSSL